MKEEWGSWMLGVFGEEEKGKKKWRSTGRGREEKMGLAVGSPPPGENQKWEESAKTLQWPAAGKKGKINK